VKFVGLSTAGDSCDSGISVLYNCLSWYKFVNTHLYHSRQLYNIQLVIEVIALMSDLITKMHNS